MRKHLFSRWVLRNRADRYIEMFGGKVFEDKLNGYTVLYNCYRQAIAFVKR